MALVIDNEVLEDEGNVAMLVAIRVGAALRARELAMNGGPLDSEAYLEYLNICYAQTHGLPTTGLEFLKWMIADE